MLAALIDFNGLQPNVPVRNQAIMKIAHDLQKLPHDGQHRHLVLGDRLHLIGLHPVASCRELLN